MLEDVLIDSPLVGEIPVVECGERLVWSPLRRLAHGSVSNGAPTRFLVRSGVAERLRLAARELMGAGAELVVVEGFREVAVQQRFWERRLAVLAERFPDWDDSRLRVEAARFVAPPDGHPPHSTGGAVDVVLFDSGGREIDLGSPLNSPGELMATGAVRVGEAGEWRRRLVTAMESAGLVNYPQEWWHYSYGDQYWAFRCGVDAACYGSVVPDSGVVNSMKVPANDAANGA